MSTNPRNTDIATMPSKAERLAFLPTLPEPIGLWAMSLSPRALAAHFSLAIRFDIPLAEYFARRAGGEKICFLCSKWKKAKSENFGTQVQSADGLKSYCRPCDSQQHKDYYRATKRGEAVRKKRPGKLAGTMAPGSAPQPVRRTVVYDPAKHNTPTITRHGIHYRFFEPEYVEAAKGNR